MSVVPRQVHVGGCVVTVVEALRRGCSAVQLHVVCACVSVAAHVQR